MNLIRAFKATVLTGIILAGAATRAPAQVTMEIVNDSGLADSNVFVKVAGYYIPGHSDQTVTPASLFADLSNPNPPNPASVPLSDLAASGSAAPYQIVSTSSGRTNTVYSIQVDYVTSGTMFFTYNQPYYFTNKSTPSPPPDSHGNAYRYDYAEFTINDAQSEYNAADITYVDKFGIPIQMEWFKGTNLQSGSYVYASTKTLVERFVDAGLGQAVFSLNPTNIASGWQYTGPASYTNFARILAPQKISGSGTSVAPYPSVAGYLDSLVGNSNAFWLNGASSQRGYYYLGYHASIDTNANGWLVTLAPGPNPPPFDPALLTGVPYTGTITFPIGYSNASLYVYGAPVGTNLYSVNGILATDPNSPTYAVETWMIGDVLSALNFGFWGGAYGTNSADWYSPVKWTAHPFGSARNPNDGFYNPYTALIYNAADPYGFAFSERITPDVLLAPVNGDRLRITLLPDDRLDSPVVATPLPGGVTSNSITLNWQPVIGASGYQLNVIRPFGIPPISIASAATTNYTLANLQPGVPYVMSVQAVGSGASGNPVITPARPVMATTAGSPVAGTGTLAQIQVTFNTADPLYQLGAVFINGVELLPANDQWLTTNGIPARWIASAGTNQVAVTVVGRNNEVVFNDWLTFELAQPFAVTNGAVVTTNSSIARVAFHGQKLSQPPPMVSGFLNGTTATNFLASTQNISLVIGLTYVPSEIRQYAPVVAAMPTVTIFDVAWLSAGAIRFDYDVPYGAPYAIESSTNLVGWQPLFGGYGLTGVESYTNAAAPGGGAQFYRIKL